MATPTVPMERLVEFGAETKRKIPKARFYEDISEVVDGKLERVQPTLQAYMELHEKYKLMTNSLNEQLVELESREKSLKEGLEVIEAAKTRAVDSEVLYKVSDCLFTRAKITSPQKVMLWLGSNVMLEYTPEEAEKVITKNLETTKFNQQETVESILALRSETTVIEVAISRLHNYAVHLRQKAN